MEEIELKYVPEIELDNDFANIKTTCFICLSEILNYSSHQNNGDVSLPPENTTQKVSLFRICHYLKINLRDVISTHSSETLFLPDEVSKLKVTICQNCNSIFENLSNFLEQLELLQMKVDYNLGKFMSIFKETDGDIQTNYEFHLPSSNAVGSLIRKPASESLRILITKNGNKRLNAVVPKVLIANDLDIQIPTITTYQDNTSRSPSPHGFEQEPLSPPESPSTHSKILISSSSTAKWKCNFCPRSYHQRKNMLRHRRDTHPNRKPTNPENKPSKIPKNSLKPNPGSRICTLCIPSRNVNPKNFERHRTCHHFESYFTSHKMPDLTQTDFKVYCEHVFKIELLSSKKILTSGGVTICHCAHCPNRFTDQQYQRTHLLTIHKQILIKKLIELQKSTTVQEIKEIYLPKFSFNKDKALEPSPIDAPHIEHNANASYYTCNICQPKRMVHISSKTRHLAHLHATTIFSASKLRTDLAEKDFWLYCEHLFDTEIKACERIKDGKRNQKIKCKQCWRTFGDDRALRSHLVSEHKPILATKLIKLQENMDVDEIREKFENIRKVEKNRGKKMKKFSYRCLPTGINCEKCGRGFANLANLKRHLMNIHNVEPEIPTGKQKEIMEMGQVEDNNFEPSVEFVTKVETVVFDSCGEFYDEHDLMEGDEGEADTMNCEASGEQVSAMEILEIDSLET